MKKLGALSLVLLIVASALFADDGLALSGEVKANLLIRKQGDNDATVRGDTDGNPGRAQFGFAWTKEHFEAKWMLRMAGNGGTFDTAAIIPYAYATGKFLNDQIRISVGGIDGALWGSGGVTDASYDAVSGARFELAPAIVDGLSVGFFLPGSAELKIGDYFPELGFGARFAKDDLIDIRLAYKGDGDGDDNPGSQSGGSFLYGVNPTILGTFVPGLSLKVDGAFRGLGGDPENFYTTGIKEYTIKNGVQIAFDNGTLNTYVNVFHEVWKDQGTTIGIVPEVSYKVTPWLRPGLYAEFFLRTYEDTVKTAYKAGSGEDPAAFDRLFVKVYAEFTLGNGFTLTPSFALTSHSAYGTFGESTPVGIPATNPSSGKIGDSRLDTETGIYFGYSF
jgi:hypothetical protein